MPVPLQVTIGVVIALLIALVFLRRARGGPPRTPGGPAPRTPGAQPPQPPPGDLADRLRVLVGAGKKIQAVKELREHTGMGLAEAKKYIDRLPLNGPIPPAEPPAGLSPDTVARAREHIAAGEPIHAVRVIRDDTGWSLKDAKKAMERIRAGGSA